MYLDTHTPTRAAPDDELIGTDPNGPDFSLFFKTFTVSIDKACKLDIPKTTIRNTINNPWITDGIINAVKEKDYLYSNWKKSCFPKVPNGDQILYTKFSDYRRCLKHIVKSVKAKYYNQKITNAIGNSKETWEIVNQIRGKAKRSVKPQFVIDNKLVTTRRTIANEFNKYFVSQEKHIIQEKHKILLTFQYHRGGINQSS